MNDVEVVDEQFSRLLSPILLCHQQMRTGSDYLTAPHEDGDTELSVKVVYDAAVEQLVCAGPRPSGPPRS